MVSLDTLERKVAKLEARTGGDGMCPHDVFVIWPDGRESGERICPICGRARAVIRVVYDD